MRFEIVSPIKAYVRDADEQDISALRSLLTYTNTAAQHMVNRHYKNIVWKNRNRVAWAAHLEELKKAVTQTVVYEDDGGTYVRPGSLPYINWPGATIENKIIYTQPKKIPWHKPLPFTLHQYQSDSIEKLIETKHGNVELTTGAGKSAVILSVYRELGMKTVVVVPSKSIFLELLDKFEHHFGKGKIGKFGAGKKVLGKNITLCIIDSLVNVKEGTEEWNFFSDAKAFIADESHFLAAETLEKVCHGVLANAQYRLFLSATQTRGDGAEMLLYSIIGKTVHTLTTKQAVEGGYIQDHSFKIVSVPSSNPNFMSQDALEMKRMHFLRNSNIATLIAKIVNVEADRNKRQSLVLVEELDQIAMLLPMITTTVAIAHSESKKDRLEDLGFSKVDPAESVETFNKGEAMVLIGTSCIATGTNIFPTHNTFNWVGGSSEIKTKQGSVGRSVRKMSSSPYKNPNAPKEKVTIWDFAVIDCDLMTKHLESRLQYYSDSGTEIKFIKLS